MFSDDDEAYNQLAGSINQNSDSDDNISSKGNDEIQDVLDYFDALEVQGNETVNSGDDEWDGWDDEIGAINKKRDSDLESVSDNESIDAENYFDRISSEVVSIDSKIQKTPDISIGDILSKNVDKKEFYLACEMDVSRRNREQIKPSKDIVSYMWVLKNGTISQSNFISNIQTMIKNKDQNKSFEPLPQNLKLTNMY